MNIHIHILLLTRRPAPLLAPLRRRRSLRSKRALHLGLRPSPSRRRRQNNEIQQRRSHRRTRDRGY